MKTTGQKYHPIVWFRATNKEEVFWSPYGLRGARAALRGEWCDRRAALDSKKVQRYRQAALIDRSIVFDHFSSHVDGTFHAKCSHEDRPVYSHRTHKVKSIDSEEPVFLEASVLTDRTDYYRSSENRASDHVLDVPPGCFLKIFFIIAVKNHDCSELMEDYKMPGQHFGPTSEFGAFQLRSIITPQGESDRPSLGRGTVVSLRFKMSSGLWLLKTFLFE